MPPALALEFMPIFKFYNLKMLVSGRDNSKHLLTCIGQVYLVRLPWLERELEKCHMILVSMSCIHL